jgi:predicted cupin superfamily sugar epimerase
MNAEAEKIIAQHGLKPLPAEGGFYRQVWVSAVRLPGGRAAASTIWFLLTREDFSAWHRVDAEEVWQFHSGDPVTHLQLDSTASNGGVRETTLGDTSLAAPLVVPAGAWQAARLTPGLGRHGWALLTCTMAPAWDEKGFELGRRGDLTRQFPAAVDLIAALTR